jgi:hypothetical protein
MGANIEANLSAFGRMLADNRNGKSSSTSSFATLTVTRGRHSANWKSCATRSALATTVRIGSDKSPMAASRSRVKVRSSSSRSHAAPRPSADDQRLDGLIQPIDCAAQRSAGSPHTLRHAPAASVWYQNERVPLRLEPTCQTGQTNLGAARPSHWSTSTASEVTAPVGANA